ncbi:tryptophan synthase subunit alpha [Oceanobacillus sp. 143]|uniref:Tryptophan synthase alpha chain n=1 Tax=Oceanobacillus zhaokaii TaxID=2052660 RepID=A0A345PD47_9BACI|nr:tryptophan synthase subunit alpha [Oceanobacillus zhaokaii]AXI07927.1 tryptophan synthase subunit alpha [Oceanobacillus zhaokaii]QGS67984.1 tryptophan synthase subunit alpha [Oceanobacillus sp. 143]
MGKERIEYSFQEKQSAGQRLFIPYIMAGDGGLDNLEDRIDFLAKSGVAAVELGIPFSDPIADGPTIQAAGQRALANGTSLKAVLSQLRNFKASSSPVPIILMTYLNPIYSYGMEKFAADCEKSGVDGIIIPDLPMEEEEMIAELLQKHSIAFIRLVAMTSPKGRMIEIAKRSEGFLYAVSVMGTTGARQTHDENVKAYLDVLKENSPVPVLAGFGVSSVEQAQELSAHCDGVIVGSRIVDLFNQGQDEEVRKLVQGSIEVGVRG